LRKIVKEIIENEGVPLRSLMSLATELLSSQYLLPYLFMPETEDYSERQRDWRNIATTQFSFTNNILITISAGYFALIFDKKYLSTISIDRNSEFDWSMALYAAGLIAIFVSTLYGFAVMFCRLYDFRISRQLALTRKRLSASKFKENKLPDGSVGTISWKDRSSALKQLLFTKLDFITSDEIKSFDKNENDLKTRFTRFRRLVTILGSASWRWTKIQVLLFLISFILTIQKNGSE
jgi:hypothetical protein